VRRARKPTRGHYPRFRVLDGRHPFQAAVPDGSVDYRVRRLRDGKVLFFNFELAREMGLIPAGHPDTLAPALSRAILDAFCLVIINEFDIEHATRFPARDLLPNAYMATRYLQLQHPSRTGTTSGDGRSIWNGSVRHNGVTWDVSSCGTGVTRLCPATAIENKHFKTGTKIASYGCGTASIAEGIGAALMSETFHRNGIATERVLAVIELSNGFAINVRAGRNLLRPSHFLGHLKQGNLEALRGVADCFAERQIANRDWPAMVPGRRRYRYLAEAVARTMARATASFEREYVFCWLDWDGDNILADGGIIDYGSIRQFGLFHREYRFDDVQRLSTTLTEQRAKARSIVQNFAQIRSFLIEGVRSPLRRFARDPILEIFDRQFDQTKRELLVSNLGFDTRQTQALLCRAGPLVERFSRAHLYFERARSSRGPRAVTDGITWNAIYSVRDLQRELPLRYLVQASPIPAAEFLAIAASNYASPRDCKLTPHRKRMASQFQHAWLALVVEAARLTRSSSGQVLAGVAERAARINRYDRITGDSIEYATSQLVRNRRKVTSANMYSVIERFVHHQILNPPDPAALPTFREGPTHPDSRRVLDGLVRAMEFYRHGL
jgi:hypothetical protein